MALSEWDKSFLDTYYEAIKAGMPADEVDELMRLEGGTEETLQNLAEYRYEAALNSPESQDIINENARQSKIVEAMDRAEQRSAQGVLEQLKNEQSFIDAGVPKSRFSREKLDPTQNLTGTIKGKDGRTQPGPFVESRRSPGGTPIRQRWYTEPYISKNTGETMLRPFPRGDDGKPLTTWFTDAGRLHTEGIEVPDVDIDPRWGGNRSNDRTIVNKNNPNLSLRAQAGTRAGEVQGLHAGWLSGDSNLRFANDVNVDDFVNASGYKEWNAAKRSITGTDFTRGKTSVDNEMSPYRGSKPNSKTTVQIFTEVDPGPDVSPEMMQARVRAAMRQGETLGDAAEALSIEVDPLRGKAYTRDELLITDVPSKPQSSSTPEYLKDKVTVEPTSVRKVDIKGVADDVASGNISPDNVIVKSREDQLRDNRSKGGNRQEIKVEFDNSNPRVKDLSTEGAVPQMLKDLEYETPPTGVKTKPKASSVMPPGKPMSQKPFTAQVDTAPPTSRRTRTRPSARIPKGEQGFVITPGARATARARVKPRVPVKGPSTITKLTKAAPVADVAIEGGLSYLTGETDRVDHAAWKGVTSLIPDAGGTAKTMDIGGKIYTHDEATNMVYDHTGKVEGLAYKDGKPTVVPYGSLKGRTSMVDDVVTPLAQTATAIKETAVRRAKEWTKPKPSSPSTGQRVMAVLNGKEGYMLKGDSSSFRMANWNEQQRKQYYGK